MSVINISDYMKKQGDPEVWIGDLSLFKSGDQFRAQVTSPNEELCLSDAEMLRLLADALDAVSFMARQQAEQYERSDAGSALGVFKVFENGEVHSRIDEERVTTAPSFEWMSDCLDLMSKSIRKGQS